MNMTFQAKWEHADEFGNHLKNFGKIGLVWKKKIKALDAVLNECVMSGMEVTFQTTPLITEKFNYYELEAILL